MRVNGPQAYDDYQRAHNVESIDGLPAVSPAELRAREGVDA